MTLSASKLDASESARGADKLKNRPSAEAPTARLVSASTSLYYREAEQPSSRRFTATRQISDSDNVGLLPPVAAAMRREQIYRRALACADGGAALATALLAAVIWSSNVGLEFVLLPLIAIVVFKVQGLYDRDDMVMRKSTLAEWRQILQATALTAIVAYFLWRLTLQHGHGVRLFAFLLSSLFLLELPARALARRIARAITTNERCLIVGCADDCEALAQRVQSVSGVELIGIVPDDDVDCSVAGVHELVEQLSVERLVVVTHAGWVERDVLKLVQSAKWLGVRVSLMPSVMTVVGAAAKLDALDSMILLGVPRFGLSRSSRAIKRTFDLMVSTVALMLSAPLLALIALAIRLDSDGPVVFKQTRIGRDGQRFTIYKFRSMVLGAEQLRDGLEDHNETKGLFKITDDPRVTRVGRLLRRTYLDELPQLINVLRGEMSLVGPRPLIESEDALLTGYDRHRARLAPGITGPWQLRGPIQAPIAELAKLDYMYASNWSVWADVDLLARTVSSIFLQSGR